ncbi:MAG: hypothetical protein Q9209_003858 [Squamulea sp. 1 TL-2023]
MYPKSAVIVGGSIAGLLQGLQLKRNGTNVMVLEQDPSKDRHSHESGVTIGPSVVSILNKYDATGRPAAIHAGYMSVAWRKRLRVVDRPSPRHMSNWGCLYLILRANFDGMSSETVPEPPAPKEGDGTVEYRRGKRVIGLSYDKDKGRVTVQYVDMITGVEDSVSADTVLAADGVHSSIAKILQVPRRKEYSGYIGWRGTCPEHLLSPETIEYFSDRLNFTILKGTYFISYLIPTETGHVEPGKRLLNWVWYFIVPDGSPEMATIFTDINGTLHPNTVPHGLINLKLWANQIACYQSQMIAPLAEVINQTPYHRLFVTKVGEAQARQASFFDDRLVLVGDAFTAFRSHMGMASEQAARHCWQMDRVWRGEITQKQRDREATIYAQKFILLNRLIGLGGLGQVMHVLKVIWGLLLMSTMQKFGWV